MPFADRSQHTKTSEHVEEIGVRIAAVFDKTGPGTTNVGIHKTAPLTDVCVRACMCMCVFMCMCIYVYVCVCCILERGPPDHMIVPVVPRRL